MSNEENKKNDKSVTISKRKLTVMVIIALLLIIGGIVVGLNWNNRFGTPQEPTTSQTGNPDIDPNAGEWNGGQLEDKGGEATGIKIPGYPSIALPANQKDVTVALLNPEGNPCYFKFELVLDDTNEVLYTSKLVPPGQAISNITLSKALTAGEYDATIRITTTSLEDNSAMNGANVETKLIVQ